MQRHSLVAYFGLAFALSWIVEVPLALRTLGARWIQMPYPVHYLSAYGPLLAAVIVTWTTSGTRGLRELKSHLTRWRLAPIWWFAAISPLLALVGLRVALRLLHIGGFEAGALGDFAFLPHLGPLVAAGFWLLTFGLGEEIGWRGFALPRLQRSRSAFSATAVLWSLWALWHLPAFFFLYEPAALPGFLVGLFAGAVIFTWLYNGTRGSILVVAVFHGLFDFTTACSACKTGIVAATLSTLVMVGAVVVVAVFGPTNLSRQPKQMAVG